MYKDDCIFCKIAKGEIPSATVYETPKLKVMMDVSPANKGHVLIVTKEHFDNIYQLDAETGASLFSLATVVAKAIKEETNCEGMNILQNNGEVAGQTVNHFHLHLIPRYKDDDVTISWKQGESEAAEREAFAKALKKRI